MSVTVDEYYAAISRLGLKPTRVAHVYVCTATGEHQYVPDASKYSPDDRAKVIARLTTQLKGY
jgi:hypothetical protein